MKVLYFSDNTSGHNQRFLGKLAEAGLEVWFLDATRSSVPENWLPEGVHGVGSRQTVPRSSDPAAFEDFLPEFRRLVEQIAPDLIHAGPIQSCGLVAALSQFHPWLLTSWGSDILFDAERDPEWKRATQVALSGADAFFCDCDTVRNQAKALADIEDSRIVQFPWGIRKGLFGPVGSLPSEKEFMREPDTHVYISTRSWDPLYGIDTLLRAFQQAYGVDSSLRLLLLGYGSEAGWVREFIDAHELGSVIRTLGPFSKEDMPKWFRAADTYVSCARSDGTSVSLLEAMATGLPPVVTDIPSNREWIEEDRNGWLAKVNSIDEFSRKLLCAARLTGRQRTLLSEHNQRIVTERADWDRNFPRLLEMYERLASIPVR